VNLRAIAVAAVNLHPVTLQPTAPSRLVLLGSSCALRRDQKGHPHEFRRPSPLGGSDAEGCGQRVPIRFGAVSSRPGTDFRGQSGTDFRGSTV